MTNQILQVSKSQVGEMKVVRDLIDHVYNIHTFKFYVIQIVAYTLMFILPFMLQLFGILVILMNVIMFVFVLYLSCIEFIQLQTQKREYFKSSRNKQDIILILYVLAYTIHNFCIDHKDIEDLPIINSLLLIQIAIKYMDWLRVFVKFGQLFQLLRICLKNVQAFTPFFFGWILIYAVLFYI